MGEGRGGGRKGKVRQGLDGRLQETNEGEKCTIVLAKLTPNVRYILIVIIQKRKLHFHEI